jgi:putative endonuclease
MTKHQITGQKGEMLARQYFESRGYDILHTNWRYGHLELDIIAMKAGKLHFIEVKTLKGGSAGMPEDSVNRKKMLNLIKAAELYMISASRTGLIQFDVLAIVLKENENEFFLLEDVYV